MDPRQPAPPPAPPRRVAQAPAPVPQNIQRYTIIGIVALCALIAGLLGDSLVGVYRMDQGEAIPRGWRWLLGAAEQSFSTQTMSLLLGVILLGFAAGGAWFLVQLALGWVRSQIGGR